MYPMDVKPITITIPEELDRRAADEARRRGISKSALIRQSLEAVLPEEAREDSDNPWVTRAGFGTPGVTVEPGEIDEVVYGL